MNSSEVRPRRWLQFSLRTLFVLMLIVAAFFGGRESLRPVIEAERAKAERARADAMLQQAAALMERDRAQQAEMQSRLMLARTEAELAESTAEKATSSDPDLGADANAGGEPTDPR